MKFVMCNDEILGCWIRMKFVIGIYWGGGGRGKGSG